jgi:hypothetical protein
LGFDLFFQPVNAITNAAAIHLNLFRQPTPSDTAGQSRECRVLPAISRSKYSARQLDLDLPSSTARCAKISG